MTDSQPAAPRQFGEGPLGQVTAGAYWLLVVTGLLALAALPTVVVVFLPDRSALSLPVIALAAVPLGPALSAALYATRARARGDDQSPARAFWHGYRINWADVLKVWVPALVVLGVIGAVLANLTSAGAAFAVVLAVIAATVAVWAMHATAISSFYSFRTRDVVRLSAYYLARKAGASLGVLALLVVAVVVVWLWSDLVMVLLGGAWVWLWYRNDEAMLDDVRARFTTEGAQTHEA